MAFCTRHRFYHQPIWMPHCEWKLLGCVFVMKLHTIHLEECWIFSKYIHKHFCFKITKLKSVQTVSSIKYFCFLLVCRKTWKPLNMFAGCVLPDSSFIRLTRVACKCLLTHLAYFLSLYPLLSSVRLLIVIASCLLLLSSERSMPPCLLRAPRSPFSLCPFLVFQCSLVPLCLLIRGEQTFWPPPTVYCYPPNVTTNLLSVVTVGLMNKRLLKSKIFWSF